MIKCIDSGKFGDVWECIDRFTDVTYAVKKISKEKLTSVKYLNFLYNEISILRKISHPLVIKLYAVYEDEEFVMLLTEYVPYGNLYKRISLRKKFNEIDVVMLTRGLFEVLIMLHNKGIIHRDLKLENILMTSKSCDFEFKLADFGLSCYTKKLSRLRSGSPGYIAPEILSGNSYSNKADVFSAGVIIYILLTGKSPFGIGSENQILERNTRCDINYNDISLSAEAKEFLKDALNPQPCYRVTSDEASRSTWLRYRKCSDTETLFCLRTESTPGSAFFKSFEKVKSNY